MRFTPHCSRLSFLLIGLMMAAGCPRPDEVDKSDNLQRPHAGVEIRFVVPSELMLAEAWTPALNDWADESEAICDLVEFDFSAVDETSLAEKLTAGHATLVLLPAPLVNALVAKKLPAPLPPALLEEGVIAWSDIPPSVRQSLGTLRDVPSLVPVTCTMPICCYRADLLETAGKQVPTTWEEYDALAASLPEWAPGYVAVEPWAEPFRPTLFLARAVSAAKHPAQYSVELDVATAEPLIATPPFVKSLEEVVALMPHLAATAPSLSPQDCLRELREGRAAMGIVWNESLKTESPPESRASKSHSANPAGTAAGPLTFAPIPGRLEVYDRDSGQWDSPPVGNQSRPALCGAGGFTVCVLSTATDREQAAAWDLWGLLGAYQADGTIPMPPGDPVTLSGFDPAAGWNGLSAAQRQQARLAVTTSLQNQTLVCELPIYGQEMLRAQLSTGIGLARNGEMAPDAALQEVRREWSETIDTLGRTKVLNSYRRRLGLTPLPE